MTSERQECYVYIVLPGKTEFVTAGRFTISTDRNDESVGSFIYGRQYLERKDAVEIDPIELRLRRDPYETARMEGIFGAIRDSMPDSWGRRLIEKRAKTAQLEEFEYLIKGSDDRAGALGFGTNVKPLVSEGRFNQMLELERLQVIADQLINDEPDLKGSITNQVEELLHFGTSMGGARPKAVVEHNKNLWLAKFNMQDDRWNYSRVEHGMLKLALACNINVAESDITGVAGRDVLLVRRFDREWEKDNYKRHRMISALTLLQSDDNPVSRVNWSYALLADAIRRMSVDPESDLRELFSRMCFNAAVSNLDDHPRNHAMLAREQGWRLSPAFDLTPSPVTAIDRRDLAMSCGKLGRYANRENLLSNHGRYLLSQKQAEEILDSIVTIVSTTWQSTMCQAGVKDTDGRRISNAFLYKGFFYENVV